MLKKLISILVLSMLLFSPVLYINAFTLNENNASTDAYYLYNFENDLVLAQKETDKIISASSTVKMMTVCVALDADIESDTVIHITEEMIKDVNGRRLGLKVGDKLTYEELLFATVSGSYNDAAQALALSVSPTLTDFIYRMNEKAQELGMTSSSFCDVTGINSKSNKTTVNDLVKLSDYLMDNELFVRLTSKKNLQLSSNSSCDFRSINNRSSLLSTYKSICNLNTGSSADQGDTVVLFYTHNDLSFLAIVMNANPNDSGDSTNYAEQFSKQMMNYAINSYSLRTVVSMDTRISTLPVNLSIGNQEIGVYPAKDLSVYLDNDVDIESELTYSVYIYNDELTAPINSGDTVGVLTVSKNGKILGHVPLTVRENVMQNGFLCVMNIIKSYVLSRTFVITLLTFAILFTVYLIRISKHSFKASKFKKKRKNK